MCKDLNNWTSHSFKQLLTDLSIKMYLFFVVEIFTQYSSLGFTIVPPHARFNRQGWNILRAAHRITVTINQKWGQLRWISLHYINANQLLPSSLKDACSYCSPSLYLSSTVHKLCVWVFRKRPKCSLSFTLKDESLTDNEWDHGTALGCT